MTPFYELSFKTRFLEAKGSEFQGLFVEIMAKAYPADFIPCRPWGSAGDMKNDGYLKSERTLFQVYAPNEMTASAAVKKIETDFEGALPHWQDHFGTWVFVHNAREGLSPHIIETLLKLEQRYPTVKIAHWGYDELLLRVRLLSPDALATLFGPLPISYGARESANAHSKLAESLSRQGSHAEALKEMKAALAISQSAGDEEEEVKILAALAIMSSDRRGKGDGGYYLELAEKKAEHLKSPIAKVIFLRARAAMQKGTPEAEVAYREALHLCCSEADDEKSNLSTQACVVRSNLVHLLCSSGRVGEARSFLVECEDYATQHRENEDGELFEVASIAGIHLSLEAKDNDGALRRIAELERFAENGPRVRRVGGELINIANQAGHRQAFSVTLAAVDASISLGQRWGDDSGAAFLMGAYFTEARTLWQMGEVERALQKAEAIVCACARPEDAIIKQVTQQLVAEIRRESGDSGAAVDAARASLGATSDGPDGLMFGKLALARALRDDGQTEEALKQALGAWALSRSVRVPPEATIDMVSQILDCASQLGAIDEMKEPLLVLQSLTDREGEVKDRALRVLARTKSHLELRQRFLAFLEEHEPAKTAGTERWKSLSDANAAVIQPLLRWWKAAPECLGGVYDFWGRGAFGRLLLNSRGFPNSFNVTVEVRSAEDVKKAVRIWGLYVDFLVLIWKGPVESGLTIVPFPEDYEGPGGWGYDICAGSIISRPGVLSRKRWYPAVTYASCLPNDVAFLLANDLLPFVKSGRLILVPAVGVGCINPGHGPYEQMLAEAANAVPSIRWKGMSRSPIGNVAYSPDAPFQLLADLAETESARLRKLRLLLLKGSRQLNPAGDFDMGARELALEIDDALRDFEERSKAFSRRRGLANAREPLSGATSRFRSSGKVLTGELPDSPFAPLLVLEGLGYGWRIEGTLGSASQVPRFEPGQGDAVGPWLAPPSAGWTIPAVVDGNAKDKKSTAGDG